MKFANDIAVLCFLLGTMGSLGAQVMTPMELSDPKTQQLQQRPHQDLDGDRNRNRAHKCPHPFYFSRVRNVDVAKMRFWASSRNREERYYTLTIWQP